MSITSSHPLPRYLQIVHWLHEQPRAMSSRETADVFGVSYRSIERDFIKIRAMSGIVVFEEERASCEDSVQYRLRVLHIYPYWLDEHRHPQRHRAECWARNAPLTWHDLLCCPWHQLAQRHCRDINE